MSEKNVAFMVYGYGVTAEQRDGAWSDVTSPFKAAALQAALVSRGVPDNGEAMRAADRMLQSARRVGTVRFDRAGWSRTTPAAKGE